MKAPFPPQWQIIAMRRGSKNPGSIFGKQWQHKTTNDSETISKWLSQNSNIGLLLGPKSGVIDIEYDTDEGRDIVENWLGGFPTPTYKSSKSIHRLFKYDDRFKDEPSKAAICGVEFRFGHDSAQSVIPPSWHEEAKINYEWIDGLSPDDCEPMELPDDFWAWYVENRDKQPLKEAPLITYKAANGGDGLVDIARAWCEENLHWPDLLNGWSYVRNRGDAQDWRRPGKTCGISATINYNGKNTLRVFSTSIPNLEADSSYDKFAFECATRFNNDPWAAANAILPFDKVAAWKQEQTEKQFADVNLSGLLNPKKEESDSLDFEHLYEQPEFPYEVLEDMPPIMKLAFDYGVAKSTKILPEATFFGLIALFSSILGRKVTDDYGTRTINMIVCIADSGSGKNAQRKVNAELIELSGATSLIGNAAIGSPQGFIAELAKVPNLFFQIDEIHGLLESISNNHSILSGFAPVWMDMCTSPDRIYRSAAVADQTRVRTVVHPNPVIYGTTTPDEFYDTMSERLAKNGFLGRMMLFSCKKPTGRKRPSNVKPDPRIIDWIKHWHGYIPNASGNMAGSEMAIPVPLLIKKTPEADAMFEQYCETVDVKSQSESSQTVSLWSRAAEKVNKMALVYACLDQENYNREGVPVATEKAIRFSKKIVNYCTRLMVYATETRMHQNEHSKLRKRVFDMIVDGMTKSHITRRTQFCRDMQQRNNILLELSEMNAIEMVEGRFRKLRHTL